jgi:hypothetical protein
MTSQRQFLVRQFVPVLVLTPLPAAVNARAADAPVTLPAEGSSPVASSQAKPAPVPAGETPLPSGENLPPSVVLPGLAISGAPGKGFTISTNDGRYSLNVRARFQVRDTGVDLENNWTNQLNIKTLRLIFSGHLFSPNIGYFLQLAEGQGDFDTAIQSTSPIYDAFVEFTQLRDLSVRVGQFFVPFDRARTIREYALQFVDRQQVVNELNLDRDVGVRAFSDDLGGLHGLLGYSLGVFSGKGKDRLGQLTPGLLYLGRFQVKPFGLFDDDIEGDLQRLSRPRLAVGGAVAYNDHTDRAQSTFGTVLTTGTVSYLHADADLVFKLAGFSFLGEYLYRQGTPDRLLVTPATEKTGSTPAKAAVYQYARDARGYVLQAGYMIIDQLEVVGRFDQVFAIGKTDPTLRSLAGQGGREAGGGINAYLNNHQLKVQGDYFRYWGPEAGPVHNQVRIQLDVTI